MARADDMWVTPGPRPNGLQAADDGLWVIDAGDAHVYKLDWNDGSVLVDIPTDTYHSSGMTVGGGNVWVASTHNSRLYKINPDDGATIEFYDPPGMGVKDPRDSGPGYIRPHGMEYIDDENMWVSIKPALRNYLINPKTMEIIKSHPTPGAAPHGIAWDNGALWCADRAMQKIHLLEPDTGEILDEVEINSPELHGLTMHEGELIFCCDPSRRVCRVSK